MIPQKTSKDKNNVHNSQKHLKQVNKNKSQNRLSQCSTTASWVEGIPLGPESKKSWFQVSQVTSLSDLCRAKIDLKKRHSFTNSEQNLTGRGSFGACNGFIRVSLIVRGFSRRLENLVRALIVKEMKESTKIINNDSLVKIKKYIKIKPKTLSIGQEEGKGGHRSPFSGLNSAKIPGISISDYLARMAVCGEMDDSVLIYAYKLLRRAIQRVGDDAVSSKMIHKMLAASILVSHKYIEETEKWTLAEFSKLAGVSAPELEQMELDFVAKMLDFEVFVNLTDLAKAKNSLIAYSQLK